MKKLIKKQLDKLNIIILANCPVAAASMGGGDRIMIENSRRWRNFGSNVELWGCQEAIGMAKNNNLKIGFKILTNFPVKKWGIYLAYFFRIWQGFWHRLEIKENSILYSASEFLPDVIGPYLAKKYINFKWVIGFYLVYQNPFLGETQFSFRKAITFLMQRLALLFIKNKVDQVWVLCQADAKKLSRLGISKNKIKVVSGGVDLEFINKIKSPLPIKYDGCFIGRFHSQKGLPDLLLAWRQVVNIIPKAKLAIIGWGEKNIIDSLNAEIKNLNLTNNIEILGFLDGNEKFRVLKEAKIFVMPSHYESWGIVAIEAMAAGLPVVAYNLSIFDETFGQALLKAPLGNENILADNILKLLKNEKIYAIMKARSKQMAEKFTWDKIAFENLNNLLKL